MERYSVLSGKDKAGRYSKWESEGLTQFFQSINIKDTSVVITEMFKLIGGYACLSDADVAATEDQPVAWRYAPMHISKIEGMPKGIEPFGAMAVAGAENRNGAFGSEEARASDFAHITVIPRNEMLNTIDGYNYLDQLFGNHLTSWVKMKGHREETQMIDLDALPERINPDLIPENDRILGAAIASELFTDGVSEITPVLIRIEKGRSINVRAKEILMAVYAVLPPRMAFENGFASYQDPKKIPALLQAVSINIFVVPADTDLSEVRSNMRIYDLAETTVDSLAAEKKNDQLFRALIKMSGIPGEDRLAAYQKMFPEDDADFFKADHYIAQFEKLIAETQALKEWKEPQGSFSTPDDVTALIRQFPICMQMPSYRKKILEKAQKIYSVSLQDILAKSFAGRMLGEDTTLTKGLLAYCGIDQKGLSFSKTTAEVIIDEKDKENEQKECARREEYEQKERTCREKYEQQEQQNKQECDRQIEAAKTACKKQLDEAQERHILELHEAERKRENIEQKVTLQSEQISKLKKQATEAEMSRDQYKEKYEELEQKYRSLRHQSSGNVDTSDSSRATLIIGAIAGILLAVLVFFVLHFAGILWSSPKEVERQPTETTTQETVETQEEPIEVRYDNLEDGAVQDKLKAQVQSLSDIELGSLDSYSYITSNEMLKEYEPYAAFKYSDGEKIVLMKRSEGADVQQPASSITLDNPDVTNENANADQGAEASQTPDEASEGTAQKPEQTEETAEYSLNLSGEYCYIVFAKTMFKLSELDQAIQLSTEHYMDVLLYVSQEDGLINLKPCFERLGYHDSPLNSFLGDISFEISKENENELITMRSNNSALHINLLTDDLAVPEEDRLTEKYYMSIEQ